jgi:fructose-specific phosphotransferase system IIC component
MRSPLRSIAAVIAGFVAASIVMMIVETLNGRILYPELVKAPEGVTDRETIRSLLASAPPGAFLVVIVAWILGGVVGGWTTARLAAKANVGHGLILGVLLTLAGVANNLMVPPPLWFWIVSLVVLAPAA